MIARPAAAPSGSGVSGRRFVAPRSLPCQAAVRVTAARQCKRLCLAPRRCRRRPQARVQPARQLSVRCRRRCRDHVAVKAGRGHTKGENSHPPAERPETGPPKWLLFRSTTLYGGRTPSERVSEGGWGASFCFRRRLGSRPFRRLAPHPRPLALHLLASPFFAPLIFARPPGSVPVFWGRVPGQDAGVGEPRTYE